MARLPDAFPFQLPREIERLFEQLIHRPWGSPRETITWNPAIDLYESIDAFVLEADLPGVRPQDIEIQLTETELLLRGSRYLEKEHEDGRFYTMERCSGHFVRSMRLPKPIAKDDMKLELHDGVLRLILPKLQQKGDAD
jgi:HSP20 family protein